MWHLSTMLSHKMRSCANKYLLACLSCCHDDTHVIHLSKSQPTIKDPTTQKVRTPTLRGYCWLACFLIRTKSIGDCNYLLGNVPTQRQRRWTWLQRYCVWHYEFKIVSTVQYLVQSRWRNTVHGGVFAESYWSMPRYSALGNILLSGLWQPLMKLRAVSCICISQRTTLTTPGSTWERDTCTTW